MMGTYDAYKMYLGIKLCISDRNLMISFDTMVQSMLPKIHSCIGMIGTSFTNLERDDKELREFLVSNFSKEDSVNPKGRQLYQIRQKKNYTEWKKNQQSITRIFDQELKKCLDIYDSLV